MQLGVLGFFLGLHAFSAHELIFIILLAAIDKQLSVGAEITRASLAFHRHVRFAGSATVVMLIVIRLVILAIE